AGAEGSFTCVNPSAGWTTSYGCAKEALLVSSPDDMP
ncbi:unnamed protein product, partial [marine sediment metagenome]